MASPFYIEPAGAGIGQGLAGIGAILQDNREREEAKALEEQARVQQADAQGALYDAWKSGNPSAMMEAAIQYPQIAEMANQGMGLLKDFQKQEATQFATEVLSNPESAAEIAERRLQLLKMQGRDPTHTMQFYDDYLQNPEGALMELQMNLAASNPDAYKAYIEMQAEPDSNAKVVGDFLVDGNTGEMLFDGSGAGGAGNPEYGLTPLIYRNPETGAYQAFQPSKGGGMIPIETPKGLEFVPDSGRMGYNPTNILEQSAAQTEAERIKGLPAAQRAQIRRQEQATMVDGFIDEAINKASPWTTGVGGLLKNIPTSDAMDMAGIIDTLEGNLAFDKLSEMRASSPTGGALGSITERELALLASTFGSLKQTQSKEQFVQNLERIREQVRNIVHGSEEQFLNTYGGAPAVTATSGQQRLRYNPATGDFE